jgi:hypothetical protein
MSKIRRLLIILKLEHYRRKSLRNCKHLYCGECDQCYEVDNMARCKFLDELTRAQLRLKQEG